MLLKEGDTGATVASLQRGLRMMCCDPNGLDGKFGPGCTAAVKKFQNKMGIEPADGICGDDTWNTLVSEIYEIQIILSAKGYVLRKEARLERQSRCINSVMESSSSPNASRNNRI